jgi:ABC-type glycerol-3-phosphate transport system permease component
MPPGMSFRDVKKEVEKWQRIRYCVVICQALPMIIITPFMQKYMKRGVMIGSLRD